MTTPAHLKHVSGWLFDLANLTVGTPAQVDIRPKVASLASVIADAFPQDATFSKASLIAVAHHCPFFPSFAELHVKLNDWWQENKPRAFVAPLDLATADMSPEERANVVVWLEHEAKNDLSHGEMARRLAVIRRYAPRGYRWLIGAGGNLLAADIAVTRHWQDEEHRHAPPTEEERAAVQRLVHKRHLDIEEDIRPSTVAPAQAAGMRMAGDPSTLEPDKRPGQLSPAQLAAVRATNPALQAAVSHARAATGQPPPAPVVAPADPTPLHKPRPARVLDPLPWNVEDRAA